MPPKSSNDKNLDRGKRFKILCAKIFPNISRAQIALFLDVSGESYLRKIEAGSTIENRALVALQRKGVNLEWLLTGEGSMMREPSQPPAISPGTPPEKLRDMARQLLELADQLEKK